MVSELGLPVSPTGWGETCCQEPASCRNPPPRPLPPAFSCVQTPTYHKKSQTLGKALPLSKRRAPRATPKSGIWLWAKVKHGQALTDSQKTKRKVWRRKVGTGAGREYSWPKG